MREIISLGAAFLWMALADGPAVRLAVATEPAAAAADSAADGAAKHAAKGTAKRAADGVANNAARVAANDAARHATHDAAPRAANAAASASAAIAPHWDVASVWSGHPVGFALLTHAGRQWVAFYDDQRRMTVAVRSLDDDGWQFTRLPSVVGWDSHNYVTLAIDDVGHVHVSGNMHCRPLVYFRTERPGDISSFHPVPTMVGRNEARCTYPRFLRGARGEFLFTYRDGSSGNGDQYFNIYDPATQAWRRLLDEPLFAGGGKMNAYFVGPVQDRSGVFHLCWVWRDTPDCATNHDLCYARSKDLVTWETAAGRPLALPITLATAEIIDPVPAGGGMINGNTKLGFDARGRPIVSYHKFDAQGNTQVYNARWEDDRWRIHQVTDWDYRWDFRGGGSIISEIHVGPVVADADDALSQTWRHVKYGSGNWRLDPRTLAPVGDAPVRQRRPAGFGRLESTWPGMQVRSAEDLGGGPDPAVRYVLRWETLPTNRDRPRPAPFPPPTMLRVYEVRGE